MTAAGAAIAVGAVMILAALALAAQSAYYRHRLAAADDTEHPDDVVVGHLRVPVLIAADGHAITPCEVAVVAHLLWHQLDTVANAGTPKRWPSSSTRSPPTRPAPDSTTP